ncbi:MAG: hypothetical protein H3C31_05120 [Brumimicrobium sp.]|nr:hypothetical protein [Brumimicrobium sp.]MCO5269814.1 hypothetical protein [Brumimicrobium sp.]
MKIQDFIQRRFTGELNNEAEYTDLLVQVFAVLIVGLVLWRMVIIFHKKKNANRKTHHFFENTYAKRWKQ